MPVDSLRGTARELFAVSLVVLFQELTLIRWLPGQVRVLAYFPNLILISAFLGLGTGALLARRRVWAGWWPVALVVLLSAALAMSRVIFTENSVSEHLWLLYLDLPTDAPVVHGVRLPIYLTFVLSAATFVPLGQMLAVRLNVFSEQSSSLWGYSWDLLGSLTGVVAFAAMSFLQARPLAWFASFLVVGAVFWPRTARIGYVVGVVAIMALVASGRQADRYSPYYALSFLHWPDKPWTTIMTNGSLHQVAMPLEAGDKGADPRLREGYHIPYTLLGRHPRQALVLGAGSGNDVAVLLDEGAEHVDAVEIDPVIIEAGRQFHPDHPYSSPKVTVFNTDARSFLSHTDKKYDFIVFGTLDSMTQLSALSNVRLDNFVYTQQSVRAAAAHLTPDGGMAMYFMVPEDYISDRLAAMLANTFQQLPIKVHKYYNLFNTIFLDGPAFESVHGAERRTGVQDVAAVPVPTDDWPYMYLAQPGLSAFYISTILFIALVTVGSVSLASPHMRRSLLSGTGMDLPLFLFGLGFLLIETRAVTQMNLVWGATWLTSAVVFGSVLFVVLASTLVTQLWPLPLRLSAALLLLSVVGVYLFPVQSIVGLDVGGRLLASVFLVGLPLFSAGLCFANLFGRRANADVAFGWNLLGAVAGGLLEFLSMLVGLRNVLLIALAAYALAFVLPDPRSD